MTNAFDAFQRGLADATTKKSEQEQRGQEKKSQKLGARKQLKEIQAELSKLLALLRSQGKIRFSDPEIIDDLPYELLLENNAGCELRFPTIQDGPSVMALMDQTFLVYQPANGYDGVKWIWKASNLEATIECVARCLARRSIGEEYFNAPPM